MLKKSIFTFVFSILVSNLAMAVQGSNHLDDVVSPEELKAEAAEKISRIQSLLKSKKLAGLLITQVKNFSWVTAGLADNHIVITSETGAASILIMQDGHRYLVAGNSEVPRLMTEGLKELGYEAREYKWFEDKTSDDKKLKLIREIAKASKLSGDIATDTSYADLPMIEGLTQIQVPLTDTEIKKYRWLGKATTEAVVEVVQKIKPGMNELEIERMTSDALMKRRIRPTVLLIGSDQRLYQYRHVSPFNKKVEKYAMVNVCARRWGLVAAVTRFVHFGKPSEELIKRFKAAAQVSAYLQSQTKAGAKADAILDGEKKVYAEQGFDGEWQQHHQGGAIGYGERDWVAYNGISEVVHDRQAFAWNPTVQGAKVEDTVLLKDGKIENLTATRGWPVINVAIEGVQYPQPDLLVK